MERAFIASVFMQAGAPPSDETLPEAHARLMRDSSLQFDRVGFPEPEVPSWMEGLRAFLTAIEPLLKVLFWAALALVVAVILFFVGREILRLRAPRAKPAKPKTGAETEWRPEPQAARDLLAQADALAAQGLFAEAAHLILLRSVEDIEKRRPRALGVSLTTREIAALKALPQAARPAFAAIGRVVERSLFGGAAVGAVDFAQCRQAYEAFALPDGWRA